MLPLAYFGIESSAFNLAMDLLILFVVVLYVALIYWTYADARRRIMDPMLIGCATAASLFPFVGTLVYIILRPPEYVEDVRERELETQAAEARLHQLDYALCPHCDYSIERDFLRCPSCLRKLKERCVSCSRPLDRAWTICPYCETEVVDAPSRRRAGRSAIGRRAAVSEPERETEIALGEGRSRPVRGALTTPGVREGALAPGSLDELAATGADDGLAAGGASEPSARPLGTGRAGRPPGGRPRPTS